MRSDNASRRFFLRLFAGTFCYQTLTLFGPRRPGEAAELDAMLSEILAATDSARQIGEAYLRQFPDERSVERLLAAIRAAPSASDRSASQARVPSREAVRRHILDDFAGGRLIVLDGWFLSETEARVCALIALT